MESDFEELAKSRADIQKFVVRHFESIDSFYDSDTESYRVLVDQSRPLSADRVVQGLTSTYTSLESVLEGGATLDQKRSAELQRRLEEFTVKALQNPKDWKSEGSAWAYCRLRSLGAAVRHCPEVLADQPVNVRYLLDPIWKGANEDLGGAYGIRELKADPEERQVDGDEALDRIPPLFPNAYLTYWALFVSSKIEKRALPKRFDKVQKALRDWVLLTLAEQVTFNESSSPHSDPQQLAWAIAGVVLDAQPAELVMNARKYDLLSQGLVAFFSQQHQRGDWDRGKPLFNYRHSGSAYCYGYETLAELLALATDGSPRSVSFAALLRPYRAQLIRAFIYAKDTALPLNGRTTTVGWGSGHQAGRNGAESWATASVFRFAQRLRVLVGRWTADEAQRLLDARQPRKDLSTLVDRGATWNAGYGSAGGQLSCYWVLPLLANRHTSTQSVISDDPDEGIVSSNIHGGRSALLFGPPGTGKTTLVEAVAGALDWPFIEVSPAQFLDKGLDSVSARADQIFRQMMELDRCVVLLDEIDELVKNRTQDTEALERFFTTTMLPRLAKLWEMGKILFFANTNNVVEIDSAVRRSQRFDAAILVLPPGQESKAEYLREVEVTLAPDVLDDVNRLLLGVSEAQKGVGLLDSGSKHSKLTPNVDDAGLIWYPLCRWDQREILTSRVRESASNGIVDTATLTEALVPIGASLANQDWANSVGQGTDRGQQVIEVLKSLQSQVRAQRRGPLHPVISLQGASDCPGKQYGESEYWRLLVDVDDLPGWASQNGFTLSSSGVLAPKQ